MNNYDFRESKKYFELQRRCGYAEDGYIAPDERSLDQSFDLVQGAHKSPARTPKAGKGSDVMSIRKHAKSG